MCSTWKSQYPQAFSRRHPYEAEQIAGRPRSSLGYRGRAVAQAAALAERLAPAGRPRRALTAAHREEVPAGASLPRTQQDRGPGTEMPSPSERSSSTGHGILEIDAVGVPQLLEQIGTDTAEKQVLPSARSSSA